MIKENPVVQEVIQKLTIQNPTPGEAQRVLAQAIVSQSILVTTHKTLAIESEVVNKTYHSPKILQKHEGRRSILERVAAAHGRFTEIEVWKRTGIQLNAN